MRYDSLARAAAVVSLLLSAGCSLTDLDGLMKLEPKAGAGAGSSSDGGQGGSGGGGGEAGAMPTGGGGAGGTMPLCGPGWDDCDGDGVCEDLMYDVDRCGRCDVACPGAGVTAVCEQGACMLSELVPGAISVVLDGDEAFVGGTGVQHVDLTTAHTTSVEGLSDRCDSIVWDLHVDDELIYAACNTEGMYMGARDGSSAAALHNGTSQAVAGSTWRVYFGVNGIADGSGGGGGLDVPGAIYRYEKGSGAPGVQALILNAEAPARLVLDTTHLYFTDFGTGTVRRVALGDTQQQDLISDQEVGAFDLAYTGSEVFWTAQSRVRWIAKGDIGSGAAPATVIDEQPLTVSGTAWPLVVYTIAVDSDWLYYTVSTEIGSGAPAWGALKRYPRGCSASCDSQAETLMVDDTSRFGHIALDAKFVYWTAFEGGKLYRRPKD